MMREYVSEEQRQMRYSGHIIGLLKTYMHDLVEQAVQEAATHETFGFAQLPYRPDQAISDLLALLDDRVESEGVQVGLSYEFLHQIWVLCNRAQEPIAERVWMETNIDSITKSKITIRELTYQALIEYMETESTDASG